MISAASFGIMPIFTKIAYAAGASTNTVLFLRFLIGAIFMFLLLKIQHLHMPTKKDMIIYFFLGAIGYVGQAYTYFVALRYTTAATVALLLYTYPAIVTVGSAVIFKEKMTARKVIALVLALSGAVTIIGTSIQADTRGIFFSLSSACIYSCYVLTTSRVVKPGESMQSSAFIMLGAAVVFGMFNLVGGFEPPSSGQGYLAILAIALICTAVAFGTFFAGMEKVGPSTTSMASTVEPVVAVVFSAIILSEPLTWNMALGGAMIVGALVVSIGEK